MLLLFTEVLTQKKEEDSMASVMDELQIPGYIQDILVSSGMGLEGDSLFDYDYDDVKAEVEYDAPKLVVTPIVKLDAVSTTEGATMEITTSEVTTTEVTTTEATTIEATTTEATTIEVVTTVPTTTTTKTEEMPSGKGKGKKWRRKQWLANKKKENELATATTITTTPITTTTTTTTTTTPVPTTTTPPVTTRKGRGRYTVPPSKNTDNFHENNLNYNYNDYSSMLTTESSEYYSAFEVFKNDPEGRTGISIRWPTIEFMPLLKPLLPKLDQFGTSSGN